MTDKHSLQPATCYTSMTAECRVVFINFSKLTKDQMQVEYLLQAVEQQRKTSATLNNNC